MSSPECNSGLGVRQYFNNHEVVENQLVISVSLRSTLSGLLNIHLHIEPELHSGLLMFDPYQGQNLLNLTILDLESSRHYIRIPVFKLSKFYWKIIKK